jgi:hypothetical protein
MWVVRREERAFAKTKGILRVIEVSLFGKCVDD